jgi:hypothetical protein
MCKRIEKRSYRSWYCKISSWYWIARTGQPEQDSQDRTARTGMPGKESWDRKKAREDIQYTYIVASPWGRGVNFRRDIRRSLHSIRKYIPDHGSGRAEGEIWIKKILTDLFSVNLP